MYRKRLGAILLAGCMVLGNIGYVAAAEPSTPGEVVEEDETQEGSGQAEETEENGVLTESTEDGGENSGKNQEEETEQTTQNDLQEDTSADMALGKTAAPKQSKEASVETQNGEEKSVPEAYIITDKTPDVNAVLKAAKEANQNALIKGGIYSKGFTVQDITLYVDGNVQVNAGVTLDHANLEGCNGISQDTLAVKTQSSEVTVKNSAELNNLKVEITGSVHNYLLHWQSGDFTVKQAVLSASGNDKGGGLYAGGGTAGSKFMAYDDSTVMFNGNVQGDGGSGIWANSDGNANAVFEFTDSCLELKDNGLNGFMGAPAPLLGIASTPTFIFENTDVTVTGNGSPTDDGEGDGFSYGYITLKNTDGGNYTFNVSDNDNNGLDGGRANNAALNAQGYHIIANNNGNIGINVSKLNKETESATIENCTVEATGNGAQGLYYKQPVTISDSTIQTKENGSDGFRFFSLSAKASVDADSSVVSEGNAGSGIYVYGKEFKADGKLELKGNQNSGLYTSIGTVSINHPDSVITDNSAKLYGGGIYNAGTTVITDGVKIYNNTTTDKGSKDSKGDDIYNKSNASITIPDVAAGNILTRDGDVDSSNDEEITHWFYDGLYENYQGNFGEDGKSHRWERDVYAKVYNPQALNGSEGTVQPVTQETALKAAYAPETAIKPVDLTLYKGGNGYDNVSGTTGNNNGFPVPGFNVTLTDKMNQDIAADETLTNDLSTATSGVQLRYFYPKSDGTYRIWNLTKYAEGSSTDESGRYVYALNLESTSGGEATDVHPKLFVRHGDEEILTDDFDISGAVNEQYTIGIASVDAAEFNQDTILANVQYKSRGKTVDVDCETDSQTATLTIRGVTDVDGENTITEIAEEGTKPVAGTPLATVPEQTVFYINGNEGMEVLDNASPALLFDEILPEGDDLDNSQRIDWLTEKAEDVCEQGNILEKAGITNPQYDFKYLDIVDQNNGDVYLTASEPVTVYMPYPEGTDKNDDFVLLHYEGLDRNMEFEDVQKAINECNVEQISDIQKLDNHIEFTTDSFSPFALIWGKEGEKPVEPENPEEPDNPEKPDKPHQSDNNVEDTAVIVKTSSVKTGDETPIALYMVCAIVAVAIAGVTVFRVKRRR